MKRRRKLGGALVHLLLIIGALFWLAPLLQALMNSFKTNGELLTNVLSLPQSLSFENYATRWTRCTISAAWATPSCSPA